MNLQTPKSGEWEGALGTWKISSYGVARASLRVRTGVVNMSKDVKKDTGQ